MYRLIDFLIWWSVAAILSDGLSVYPLDPLEEVNGRYREKVRFQETAYSGWAWGSNC